MAKILLSAAVLLILPVLVLAVDKIDINSSSALELEELAGVGPVLAQRIIDARPFSSVDDLIRVKGIGEKTLQKIKNQGLAYVTGETQQNGNRQTPTATESPTPSTQNLTPNTQTTTYLAGVIINEILPSPEGADEINEFIELYNSNGFEVSLLGFKLEDVEGTITSYIFKDGAEISAKGYLILKRPDTKITLNNEKDGLNLIQPDGKTISSVSYQGAPRNQSYNNTTANWQWSAKPTPGSANIIAAATLFEKSPPEKPKIDRAGASSSAAVSQAANLEDILNQKDNNKSNPWFWFLLSGLIMILLGAAVLAFYYFKRTR